MIEAFDHKRDSAIYFGMTEITLEQPVSLPRGMTLSATYAHLMSSNTMAFSAPEPGKAHSPPWTPVRGGDSFTITAELRVPVNAGRDTDETTEIASSIIRMLRLCGYPSSRMVAIAHAPFQRYREEPKPEFGMVALETHQTHYPLGMNSGPNSAEDDRENFRWVAEYLETYLRLSKSQPVFRLASKALDAGQFLQEEGLILVSLWGALEAIFVQEKTELRFRASAMIAAYLHPPGNDRYTRQKSVLKLYDKRSSAAHGFSKHADTDVLDTFNLLRNVILMIIHEGHVPSREELERRLFGADQRSDNGVDQRR